MLRKISQRLAFSALPSSKDIDSLFSSERKRNQLIPLLLAILIVTISGGLSLLQYNNLVDLDAKITGLESKVSPSDDKKVSPSDDKKEKLSYKEKLEFEKVILGFRRDYKNAQNSLYTSLIPMLSGLFFVLTAYLGWCNLHVANETLRTTQKRFELDIDKIEVEKFVKMLEEVEDKSHRARQSAALYKLSEFIKNADAEDQKFVVKFLTAFISDVNQNEEEKVSNVVQDALTIIFSIKENLIFFYSDYTIDLSGLNLTRAQLIHSPLNGDNLRGATLREADLEGAKLRNAQLIQANLEQAYVGECDFTGANLSNANLNQINSRTSKAPKSVTFTGAIMRGAYIKDGAKLNGSEFQKCKMNDAKLNSSDFSNCNFSFAMLNGADLSDANLSYAIFEGASLAGVTWDNADVLGADFTSAERISVEDLKKAFNLDKATLSESIKKELGYS
jgi:uncharacterized protein YjbI with pentapeptide repeats